MEALRVADHLFTHMMSPMRAALARWNENHLYHYHYIGFHPCAPEQPDAMSQIAL